MAGALVLSLMGNGRYLRDAARTREGGGEKMGGTQR